MVNISEATVYTKPFGCQACVNTKRKLVAVGVEFTEVDATEPDVTAWLKEQGHLGVPVVVAGDDVWVGFRPDKIEALAARIKEEGK